MGFSGISHLLRGLIREIGVLITNTHAITFSPLYGLLLKELKAQN